MKNLYIYNFHYYIYKRFHFRKINKLYQYKLKKVKKISILNGLNKAESKLKMLSCL